VTSSRFDVGRAKELQEVLANRVDKTYEIGSINNVVGLDVAYVKDVGIAVAALLNYPQLQLKEYVVVEGVVEIPYVPGLLAFREAPLMIKAYEKLGHDADLVVVDGHGITHPRKFGIASHIGLVLDVTSIGVAKNLLYGDVVKHADGIEYIVVDGEVCGLVYRWLGKNTYVSIGHRISMKSLMKLIPNLYKNHYLPEPTYIADTISKKFRRL
jgi:deoxyribonuclease V